MINNRKLFKNSIYSLGGKVVNMIVNFGGMAILARLISPEEFGVFAIILSVQMLFQAVLDMGLGPVYIKKKTLTTAFISSFFTINIILGLLNVIYLIGAIFVLNFIYEDINFGLYISLFLVSIIFSSLSLIYQFHLTREEKFDKIFIVNTVSNIFSFIISIGIVNIGEYGVEALVSKAVSFSVISFFLLYFYNKDLKFCIIKFNIIKRYLRDIKFGIEIFINRIINGVFESLDRLIIAKFYSVSIAGNYNNAKNLSLMSDSIVRTSLTSVVFSRLEKFSEVEKRKKYIKYYGISFIISSFIPLILFLWGNKIILIWLGDKWTEASILIKPLSIFALGSIIKGITTMISIHEMKMKSFNKYNAICSFILLFALLILVYKEKELEQLLYWISILWLFCWINYLFLLILLKDKKNESYS